MKLLLNVTAQSREKLLVLHKAQNKNYKYGEIITNGLMEFREQLMKAKIL